MKKIIALLMALVVLSTSAFASINISLDGQVLEVPEEMGKPFAQDNRTYVPIRFMLEYFGYDVTYSPAEKQVIGTDANGSLFMMQIGNSLLFFKSADANEINKITMDVTPVVDYSIGRIYIPASFLIKEMGHGVEYDKETKTVVITTKASMPATPEETVSAFLDAFKKFDMKKAITYLDKVTEDINEGASVLDKNNLSLFIPEEFKGYEEQFGKVLDAVFDKLSESISFEIIDTKIENEKYIFTIKSTVPDAAIDEIFNADTMTDSFVDFLMSGSGDSSITEDMSEEEIMNFIADSIIEFVKNIEIPTTVEDDTLVVYKSNGRWLISLDESTIE